MINRRIFYRQIGELMFPTKASEGAPDMREVILRVSETSQAQFGDHWLACILAEVYREYSRARYA